MRAKRRSLNSTLFSQCYFNLSKCYGKIGSDKRSPSFSLNKKSAFLILSSPLRHSTENIFGKKKDIFE